MPKLRAEVVEATTGFARFTAILSIVYDDEPFVHVMWNEKFQGRTAAEKAVVMNAKKYLKSIEAAVTTKVFEQEWEL